MLSSGLRRIAYDSLGVYQQLHAAALDPRSPEAWAQARRYAQTVSAILGADGVRRAFPAVPGWLLPRWLLHAH